MGEVAISGQQLAFSADVEAVRCCLCGELPRIVRVKKNWWNAEHDVCDGQPGVGTWNSPSRERAVKSWNRLQRKIALGQVAIMRLYKNEEM